MNWFKTTTTQKIAKAVLVLSALVLVCYGFRPTSEINAAAGINKQLNYQGKLMTKTSGVQVSDTSWNFKFEIWNASSLLWTERWTSTTTQVTTVNGIFSVPLGSLGQTDNLSDIDWNTDELYLKVTLDADANGSWEESFTNKRITSSAYAFNADEIDGLHATSTAAVANYLLSLDSAANLNLLGKGVSSTVATTTEFLNVGTGTGANVTHLDRSGGDLYVADDVEIDSDLSVAGNATTTGRFTLGSTNPTSNATFWSTAGTNVYAGYFSGNLYVSGNATATGNFNIGGYASTTNLVLGNDGVDLGSYNDLYVNSNELFFNGNKITGSGGLAGSPGAWQWNGFALTPTSTSAGIFVNASSTVAADFRVDGNSTTTGKVVIGSNPVDNNYKLSVVQSASGSSVYGGYVKATNNNAGDYICSGTHSVCSTYTGSGQSTCESHSCAWNAAEGQGLCGGTANSCASYGDSTTCGYAGCVWDDGSTSCSTCNSFDGNYSMCVDFHSDLCAWDGDSSTCNPIGAQPVSCSNHNNSQTPCEAIGCSWTPTLTCNGAPHTCSSLNQVQCSAEAGAGCSWVYSSGAGTAYGLYSSATGQTGSTVYGLYTTAGGGLNNYAGYFSGNLYTSGNATTTNTLQVSGALATGTARPNSTTTANFGGNVLIQGGATTTQRLVVGAINPTNDFGKLWIGGDLYNSGNATTTNTLQVSGVLATGTARPNSTTTANFGGGVLIQGNSTTTGKIVVGTTTPALNFGIYANNAIISGSGLGGSLTALNPANQSVSISLGWLNNIARLRYGGTGAGATGGFQIQGAGDTVKFSVDDSGNATTTGGLSVNSATLVAQADTNRVGIGTASPDTVLHVNTAAIAAGTDNWALKVQNPNTVADARVGIAFAINAHTGANWDGAAIEALNDGVSAGDLVFGSVLNNVFTEKMRLDVSSGYFGIGDTSPTQMLTVGNGDKFTVDSLGNATSTGKLVVGSENPTVAGYLISADNTSGAPYTVGSYTIFGEIGETTAIARGGIGYHPNENSSYGVYGEVDTSNTGNGVAVYGQGRSTNYGALGYNTGAAYGVYGYFDAIHSGYIGSALYGGYFNGGLYSNGAATTTGFLSVGVGAANDDDYIFFDTGTAEYLSWDDNPGEFDLSDDLNITGSATTSGSFQATGGLATGTARPNSTTTANFDGNIYIQGRATTTGNLTVGTTGYQSARNTGVLSNLYYNGTAAASGMDFYTFVDNDTPSYIRGIAGLAALVNSTVAGGFTMEAAHTGITLNNDTISGGTSNLVGYHTDDTITGLTVSGSPIINMIGFESSLNQDISQTGTVTKYGIKVDTAGLADTNYGIYASASGAGTNYAGYFAGDIVVTGSGSKFTSLPASDGFANYVCVGLDGTLYQQSGTACGGAAHIMEKIAAATSSLDLMPGEVVVVDPDKDESVARSTKAYDPSVVGIISASDNGFIIGGYGNVYITLAGRLKAKVSGENGPIRRGDPITTSNTPGHGMLATKSNVGVYAIALEPFDPETASSTGEVLALARTGYSMPQSAQTPTAPADGQADDLLVSQNDFSSVTLSVQQAATFYGTITVIGEAGFEHNVVFKKDVEIQGKLYVSSDQAGTIKLSANATSTEVLFASEYQTIPKIVATLNSLADVKFAITEKSTKSFRLAVLEPKGEELSFDWIAMPTKTPSQMPVITDLIFTKNQATAGDAVELWAKVTDPDNADTELKYTWSFSPSNGAIDGNTGLVYWTVDDVNQDTEVTITVTVFDGYNTVSQSKAVTVVKKGIATDQPTDTTAPTENPQNSTSTPAIVSGCMNNLATNYNSLATQDDGSCLLASNPPTGQATTTPAVTPPPSQEPTIVSGCMNNLATNYNPLATKDDGSCQLASNTPPEEPPNPPAPSIVENNPSTPQPASDNGTGGGQIPDSTD